MGSVSVSWDAEEFVGLEGEAPAGVGLAVGDGGGGVGLAVGAVHGLEEEGGEGEVGEALGLGAGLGEDQLQLIAGGDDEVGAGFGGQAHPVDAVFGGAGGQGLGAVGFDGDGEASGMEAAAQC